MPIESVGDAEGQPTHSLSAILKTTSGSLERAQRFISLIVDEIPPLLADLDLDQENTDPNVVERAAHTLKTHASYVGAEAFRAQAERTELLARSGNCDGLRTETERLASLGHATLNALKSIDWEQPLAHRETPHHG